MKIHKKYLRPQAEAFSKSRPPADGSKDSRVEPRPFDSELMAWSKLAKSQKQAPESVARQIQSWTEAGLGADTLSKDDVEGIRAYTDSGYVVINQNLRHAAKKHRLLKGSTAKLVEQAVRGITKLKPSPGVYYRGGSSRPEVYESYQPGAVISDPAILSCEKDRVHPKYLRRATTAKLIYKGAARDVSPWGSACENEVVFPPFTKFRVVSRDAEGLRPVITLEEVLET